METIGHGQRGASVPAGDAPGIRRLLIASQDLSALCSFVAHLPAHRSIACTVLPLCQPAAEPVSEMLAAVSPWPVRVAEPGLKLSPDRLYLVWPCSGLALHQGRLLMSTPAPVDSLQRWLDALADDGPRALAVLLPDVQLPAAAARRFTANGAQLLQVGTTGPDGERLLASALPALVEHWVAGVPVAEPVDLGLSERVARLLARVDELDALLAGQALCTILLDRQLRVRQYSATAQRYFNLMPQDIGRPLVHLSRQLLLDDLTQVLQGVLTSGEPAEREVPMREGSLQLLRIHPCPAPGPLEGGLVLTVVDLSALASTDPRPQRMGQDLQSFAYSVSHDLQEPVRMIVGFAELLQRRYASVLAQVDDAERYLTPIRDGAQRLRLMLDAILRFSRVESAGGQMQPLPLATVLDEAVAPLRPQLAEMGAELSSSQLPEVLGDRAQLVILLRELLVNALKFAADTPLRMRLDAQPDEHGSGWVLRLSDNGIGIPPARAEQVFQIFRRLQDKPGVDGLGVGLALARRIIERHGGELRVEPSPLGGACMRFTLPSARTVHPAVRPAVDAA